MNKTTVLTVKPDVSSVASPFPLTSLEPSVTDAKRVEIDPLAKGSANSKNLTQQDRVHLREDPISFGRQLGAWVAGTGWRGFTSYVGAPIFFPEMQDMLIERVMTSDAVLKRIDQLSERRVNDIEKMHEEKAKESGKSGQDLKLSDNDKEVLREEIRHEVATVAQAELKNQLVANMTSMRKIRFIGAVVTNLIVRMYHQGVHVSLPQVMKFREVAEEAHRKKQSIFFLPCHKSHIDYLTISYLMYRLGFALPHIIAGENLNLPIVGSFLSSGGSVFIRRSFGDDKLYPILVQEYITQLLMGGYNIECFIEGGRSRTGKLLPPKLGILKYVASALESGRVDDVIICPLSLQYDRVIETESYINELLGKDKEQESLMGLINNTSVLALKMGRIDIRFGQTFSMREFLSSQVAKRFPGGGVDHPFTRGSVLNALGYKVLNDINDAAVIMPAALVGSVLLTLRGRGVGRSQLIRRVQWLVKTIIEHGGNVIEFVDMSLEEVIDRTLLVLKDEIGEIQGTIEPTFYAAKRFELSFHRNQIIHLFVNEALTCATLYTHIKIPGQSSKPMPFTEIMSNLAFISFLLKREFVYHPEGLIVNATHTIETLEKDRVIEVDHANQLISLSQHEVVTGRENFDFYCFLMWPFIETYWLAVLSLLALVPPAGTPGNKIAWVSNKPFRTAVQRFGKTLFHQGEISYLEAINQATLDNAFVHFVDVGIILQRRKQTTKKPLSLIALHPSWVPGLGNTRLNDMLTRVGTFRREGKSRRDTPEVSQRVISLLDTIQPPVIEYTTVDHKLPPTTVPHL